MHRIAAGSPEGRQAPMTWFLLEQIDMRTGWRWVAMARGAVLAFLLGVTTLSWSATIAATVTRAGPNWTLSWTGTNCNFFDFFNATTPPRTWSLRVNGVTAVAPLAGSNFIGGPPDVGSVDLTAPNGLLTLGTIDGLTSFACGPDILTLPGHIAGPASIPTLSEWTVMLMVALMGWAGVAALARSRANALSPDRKARTQKMDS